MPPDIAEPFTHSVRQAERRFDMPSSPYPETARSLQIWHPWEAPFPGSTDFRVNAVFASPGGGVTTPATLLTQLPQRKQGILRLVSWAIANLTVASDISWAVLVNGMPVLGWERLTVFPGNVPRITVSEECRIELPSGAKVEIAFTNTDGAAYAQVGAGYYGWWWDEQSASRWAGETT